MAKNNNACFPEDYGDLQLDDYYQSLYTKNNEDIFKTSWAESRKIDEGGDMWLENASLALSPSNKEINYSNALINDRKDPYFGYRYKNADAILAELFQMPPTEEPCRSIEQDMSFCLQDSNKENHANNHSTIQAINNCKNISSIIDQKERLKNPAYVSPSIRKSDKLESNSRSNNLDSDSDERNEQFKRDVENDHTYSSPNPSPYIISNTDSSFSSQSDTDVDIESYAEVSLRRNPPQVEKRSRGRPRKSTHGDFNNKTFLKGARTQSAPCYPPVNNIFAPNAQYDIDHKKKLHNEMERGRRQGLKELLDDLKSTMPEYFDDKTKSGKNPSKREILETSIKCITDLREEKSRLLSAKQLYEEQRDQSEQHLQYCKKRLSEYK